MDAVKLNNRTYSLHAVQQVLKTQGRSPSHIKKVWKQRTADRYTAAANKFPDRAGEMQLSKPRTTTREAWYRSRHDERLALRLICYHDARCKIPEPGAYSTLEILVGDEAAADTEVAYCRPYGGRFKTYTANEYQHVVTFARTYAEAIARGDAPLTIDGVVILDAWPTDYPEVEDVVCVGKSRNHLYDDRSRYAVVREWLSKSANTAKGALESYCKRVVKTLRNAA